MSTARIATGTGISDIEAGSPGKPGAPLFIVEYERRDMTPRIGMGRLPFTREGWATDLSLTVLGHGHCLSLRRIMPR